MSDHDQEPHSSRSSPKKPKKSIESTSAESPSKKRGRPSKSDADESIQLPSPIKGEKERVKDTYELPLTKVRNIMKTAPDVHNINEEGLYAMTKAAELFIAKLANGAYEESQGRAIKYNDLAAFVQNSENLEYMHDILPRTVRYRDVKHIVEQQMREDQKRK